MGRIEIASAGAIAAAVEARREETVGLLQELVRTPSVTGEEGAVQEVVEAALRELDLEIDRLEATPEDVAPYREQIGEQTAYEGRPNLVGTRRGSGGGRSLLLNAHVDTVESGNPSAWSRDPLGGEIVGDLLYGRGACDMKGGLATHLAALRALSDLEMDLSGDVSVAATVGEENGGLGALATILAGHRADAVLITEPTRLALVPVQGGDVVMRVTVKGRSAHAATRDRGVSAFEKFLPIFEELRTLEKERNAALRHPLYEGIENKVPINLGVVRAGDRATIVPEELVAEVRVGLFPGEELAPFRSLIEERILTAADRDPWLREHAPSIEWAGGQSAPAEVPADAPICEAVQDAHQLVTGKKPRVQAVPYGADMRLFVRLGNMPCVMYGAGDVNDAHAPDEHISIAQLMTATKTVACLTAGWCGVAE